MRHLKRRHGRGRFGRHCCDMRGMLSFLILFLLSKKSMHGQEIADEIGKRKGARPSPGTIYPALKMLKSHGLIEERREGKTVVYNLTEEGREGLKHAKMHFMSVFKDVMKSE